MRAPATATLTLSAILLAVSTPTLAEEQGPRAILSEPYEVENASAAMDEIMLRDDETDAADQELLMSGEVDLNTFVPSQPVFQAVTWPYESCTDVASLFPPPLEGWAIRSDWGQYENPISDERGELFYVTVPDVPFEDPGFGAAQQTLTVRVSADPAQAQLWEMRMDMPEMRDVSFDEGPFGYPTLKLFNGTMLGDFYVEVTSSDDAAAKEYLAQIIGCAIDSGTIAFGVDPATLTR